MKKTIDSLFLYCSVWYKEFTYDFKTLLKNKSRLAITIFMSVGFLLLIYVGFYRVIDYVSQTSMVGMALVGRLVDLVVLSLFIMLVYSSIITAFSVLYFSQDNRFLMTTPMDMGGLLLGKLFKTSAYSAGMSLIVFIPFLTAIWILFKPHIISIPVTIISLCLYFITATTIGLIIVIFAVNIFPARKIKDLLIVGLVLTGIAFYVLFRLMDIEQILAPGQETLASAYLKYFELPRADFLPSYWISKVIIEFINKRSGWVGPLGILCLAASAFSYLYYLIASKFFYYGWEKVQSEEKKRYLSKSFSKHAILDKDIKTFFRDTRQWTQLLLVLALIIVYIFNIYKLPLDIPYIHYLIAFLNIGMVGFVISAVGLRFSFSSISLEGRYFWLVLSSPYSIKRLMVEKYIENIVPVGILGIILIVVSNAILKPPGIINIISIVVVITASFTITSLGIGMGAIYPKFGTQNPAEVETSWGAVMYMIISTFYTALTMSLLAVWVRMYFMYRVRGHSMYYPAVFVIIAILFVINITANILPLLLGYKNLKSIEFLS